MSDPITGTRQFPIADVVTVYTGYLLAPIEGMYSLLSYLTGETIYTHQIPRAVEQVRPWLEQQQPWLSAAGGYVERSRRAFVAEHGEGADKAPWAASVLRHLNLYMSLVPLSPLPGEQQQRHDPIEEAIEMLGGDGVIVVASQNQYELEGPKP